ncbi:amidohydrolase family protein [Undibacterium flavidum]|nr:amidohydrolase family protein [Undibacterium flavidum]
MLRSLFVLGLFTAVLSPSAYADSLLIKQAKIVQPDQAQASAPQDVLIRDGKIVAIGKNLGKSQAKSDRQIDGRGKFLVPGLIDTHVHLDGVPGYAGKRPEDEAMLKEARLQMPRSYAYFGFTTVLDLTGNPSFIADWNSQPAGPQAYFCAPVTIPNGYPASWMDKDLQFQVEGTKYMLFDPAQPTVYPANFKPEAHTPQAVVAAAKQDGASCIKVFYETGFGAKKNLPVPSPELIQAVVAHAKSLKMPVYLHGNSQAAYEFALKTGVTTLVHGMWHETKQVDPLMNQQRLQAMARELATADISIQPTIQVLYGEQEAMNPDFFKNPQVDHAIPQQLASWYQSDAGQWMSKLLAEELVGSTNSPAERYQAFQKMYAKPLNTVRQMTQQLQKNGARLLFGSDTPSGPFYTQFPGVNGRWEMDRWLETGMSLPQLFSALTINNARALGLEQSIGSVEVGKRADLLLLDRNPLLSVEAYDSIAQVILHGKPHARASLSAH